MQMHRRQAGFTIVELAIATTVFSLVLIVVLYGVLSFTHAYYRGINNSATQNTARSIVSNVSQAIEFSGGIPTGDAIDATPGHQNVTYFCDGSNVYVYQPGVQFSGSPTLTSPGLYEKPASPGCTFDGTLSGGRELLAKGMRVAVLTVQQNTSSKAYMIAVRLALGDDDLLCSPATTGSCAPNGTLPVYNKNDLQCKQHTGYQFCAVAALGSTATVRVDNGG